MLLTGVILNIILVLLWIGVNAVVSLTHSFSNHGTHHDSGLGLGMVLVPVMTLGICVAVWFVSEETAYWLFWAPLVAILLMQSWDLYYRLTAESRWAKKIAKQKEKREANTPKR